MVYLRSIGNALKEPSMTPVRTRFVASLLAALGASTAAVAQSPYYDDLACRQYAQQAVAPLQAQSSNNQVGSALLGAGLGAALGAAVGGGRGAGIGAASGAIVGTGAGAAAIQRPARLSGRRLCAAALWLRAAALRVSLVSNDCRDPSGFARSDRMLYPGCATGSRRAAVRVAAAASNRWQATTRSSTAARVGSSSPQRGIACGQRG